MTDLDWVDYDSKKLMEMYDNLVRETGANECDPAPNFFRLVFLRLADEKFGNSSHSSWKQSLSDLVTKETHYALVHTGFSFNENKGYFEGLSHEKYLKMRDAVIKAATKFILDDGVYLRDAKLEDYLDQSPRQTLGLSEQENFYKDLILDDDLFMIY